MSFDPDAYLAAKAPKTFDPDAYLKAKQPMQSTGAGGRLLHWLADKQGQATQRMSGSLNKLIGGDPADTNRAVNMAIGMGGIPANVEIISSLPSRMAGQMSEALTPSAARTLYGKQAADPQQGLKVPIASDLTPSAAKELENAAVTPGPSTPPNPTVNARPPSQGPQMAGESFGVGPSRPQRGATKAQLEHRAKFLSEEVAADQPPRIGAADLSTPTLKKLQGMVEMPPEIAPISTSAMPTEAEREALRQRWREMSGSKMAPIGEPAPAQPPAEGFDQWTRQPSEPNALYTAGAKLRARQAKSFDALDAVAGLAGLGHSGSTLEAAAMSAGSRLLRAYGPKALGLTMQGISKIPASAVKEIGKQSLGALLRELAVNRSETPDVP